MLKQIKIIKDFCKKEGFNFVDCDEENRKVPCSLDKKYIEDNQTIFIKGFIEGSKRVQTSWGGLKTITNLKIPINEIIEDVWIKKTFLPSVFICDKCGKKNLNLSTQDEHKTYDCPDCQEVNGNTKNS